MANWLVGGSAAAILALVAYLRGKLTLSGSIAALAIGTVTLSSSEVFATDLLLFYYSSTYLTKVGRQRKDKKVEHVSDDSIRSAWQVLGSGLGGALIAGVVATRNVFSSTSGAQATNTEAMIAAAAACGHLGFYAACCADTWASEIGMLSKQKPWMLNAFLCWGSTRRVPAGTNGGVTSLGLQASAAGAAMIATGHAISALAFGRSPLTLLPWPAHGPACVLDSELDLESVQAWLLGPAGWHLGTALLLGATVGFIGSIMDSVVGGAMQLTVFDTKEGKVLGDDAVGARLQSEQEQEAEARVESQTHSADQEGHEHDDDEFEHHHFHQLTSRLYRVSGVGLLSNEGVNVVSGFAAALMASMAGVITVLLLTAED